MSLLVALVERLLHDIADLKLMVANTVRVGPVADIDPARGYRVAMGVDRDGNEVLSPWLPHPDSGGANADWVPLSKGQIVGVLSPSGDIRQAVLMRAGFGGENKPPSQDPDEVVLLSKGKTRIFATEDGVVIKVGDSRFVVAGPGITLESKTVEAKGGALKHDGVDVGKDHAHTRVAPGDGESGPPRQS